MLLSTWLACHRGLWCHPCIGYGNRSFEDNKTRLPEGIVNTLQHTLVPQSSIGSVESLSLDWAQAGTTAHTALWNDKERGTAESWEPGRHLTELRCLLLDLSRNRVGAGSLVFCLRVFVIMIIFLLPVFSVTALITVCLCGHRH